MRARLALISLCLALVAPRAHAAPTWTCYFQSSLTDLAYSDAVSARVQKHWRAPKAHLAPGKKTVVRAVLGKGGELKSTELHLSSGSKPWDDALLRALQSARPYPPLPKSYAYDTLEFDCHVGH